MWLFRIFFASRFSISNCCRFFFFSLPGSFSFDPSYQIWGDTHSLVFPTVQKTIFSFTDYSLEDRETDSLRFPTQKTSGKKCDCVPKMHFSAKKEGNLFMLLSQLAELLAEYMKKSLFNVMIVTYTVIFLYIKCAQKKIKKVGGNATKSVKKSNAHVLKKTKNKIAFGVRILK